MERCCLQAATSMRCLLPSSERRAASPIPVNELPTHFRAHSLRSSHQLYRDDGNPFRVEPRTNQESGIFMLQF